MYRAILGDKSRVPHAALASGGRSFNGDSAATAVVAPSLAVAGTVAGVSIPAETAAALAEDSAATAAAATAERTFSVAAEPILPL
eukprot:scaffold25071_cov73-Isochrysis_galbana.AAC.1